MDLSTLANAAESALSTYGNSQTAVTNDQATPGPCSRCLTNTSLKPKRS